MTMGDMLEIIGDAVNAYGVKIAVYGKDLAGLAEYDDGLRSLIFQRHDTGVLAASIMAMEPGVLYFTQDVYACRYCFFHLPESPETTTGSYCAIGPWLADCPVSDCIDLIMRRAAVPEYLRIELTQYLYWIPVISSPQSWEALLLSFTSRLYGGQVKIRLSRNGFYVDSCHAEYSPKSAATLSIQIIEECYHNEDAMLAAISEGDVEKALECLAWLRRFRGKRLVENELRDRKNYCIILNTLFRRAVENGFVHPAHIDAISADFNRRIEATTNMTELNITELGRLSEMMLRRYCDLVQQFSLRGFSPLVRNAINTVDFNLQEPLCLNYLAEKCNVNASYLSTLFKKEKGMTLTDYIITKRMQRAASLLRSSRNYIQEIAEECGFLDVNYFTRLFKRYYGQSPRAFRESTLK
ncbi:MAG: helix-turn-helix transcriptional regulator [Treponema sp.]|nr:helix-turn-helix transcriptional regulator [Treponema sp.]